MENILTIFRKCQEFREKLRDGRFMLIDEKTSPLKSFSLIGFLKNINRFLVPHHPTAPISRVKGLRTSLSHHCVTSVLGSGKSSRISLFNVNTSVE